jgi:hypothetical protein
VASKLDTLIAQVALAVPDPDPTKMMAVAAEVATQVSAAEAAKLPARWHPKITSKAAGAPQFRDSWPRAWFCAVTEVLCQKGTEGLPALVELLERDTSSYHDMVVLRLLRLAALGADRDKILDKLKARLPSLHQTQVYASVREVVFWSEREPEPLELLRHLAKLKVKNAEGATVGTYIKQYEAELAQVRARRAPQKAGDAPAEAVVSTAVLALEPEAFRARAAETARMLGPTAVGALVERLNKPDLPTLQSRAPATLPVHSAIWARAVIEILGHLGSGALPAARALLDGDDDYLREKSLRLLFLLAARGSGADREAIVGDLRTRISAHHHRVLRPVVSDLLLDARLEPRVREMLDILGDVTVKDYGNGTIALAAIVQSLYVPPKAPVKAADVAACKEVGTRFGTAVVAKDFAAAQGMFCAGLRKKYTPKKLAALVARESKHSGAPDAFEYADNDTTLAGLRQSRGEFPALPDYLTAKNFRRWCCLQFQPEEGSEANACFDWWMAVMEERGQLRIGYFHILDAD